MHLRGRAECEWPEELQAWCHKLYTLFVARQRAAARGEKSAVAAQIVAHLRTPWSLELGGWCRDLRSRLAEGLLDAVLMEPSAVPAAKDEQTGEEKLTPAASQGGPGEEGSERSLRASRRAGRKMAPPTAATDKVLFG